VVVTGVAKTTARLSLVVSHFDCSVGRTFQPALSRSACSGLSIFL